MIIKVKAKATGLVEFVADHTEFRAVESLTIELYAYTCRHLDLMYVLALNYSLLY